MMGARNGERKLMLGASRIQGVLGGRGGLEPAWHQRVAEDDLGCRSAACLNILLPQVYKHFLTMQVWILTEYAQGTIRHALDG